MNKGSSTTGAATNDPPEILFFVAVWSLRPILLRVPHWYILRLST
jgi:hypothetical protein